MKKQFYLLIPILLLMLTNLENVQAQNPIITTYVDFDTKYTGEQVQMTFCETTDIELSVNENQNNGVPYESFSWYYLGQEASGTETPIGADSPTFTSNEYAPGYHIFRVYGYTVENQIGCYEFTDIAVYVLPNIPLTPQGVIEQYCETDLPPIIVGDPNNSLGLGAIVLDATVDQTAFPDIYALNYQWSKSINDGASTPIGGATSDTYIVGSATDDNYATVGVHTYSVQITYAVNENGCPVEEVMAVLTVTPKPDKPVINVGGGHGRPTN